MNGIVVTVIGGGSSYTPELAAGIARRHEALPVGELRLVDVPEGREKLEIIGAFARRMFAKADLHIAVSTTMDRRSALRGADFVITQLRVGGLGAREKDERIPLRYGLVGQETTGPGGFAKALRTVPVILDICEDITELCPRAWLVNFTNPSGLITEAVLNHSSVNCMGLCNVPVNMARSIAQSLGVEPSRLKCRFAGVNHLSFITQMRLDGKDILADVLGSPKLIGELFKDLPAAGIPTDFVRALGVLPSSYLQYYYLEREIVEQEQARAAEGQGTRAREVMGIEKDLFALYATSTLTSPPPELMKRGGAYYSEVAISLMESLWTDGSNEHVVNVRNGSSIPDLPTDSVIETNCVVNAKGAFPLTHGPIPQTVRGLVQHAKAYERLTIEAAISGNKEAAIVALAANPLVREPGVAARLLDDILEAHADFLFRFARR